MGSLVRSFVRSLKRYTLLDTLAQLCNFLAKLPQSLLGSLDNSLHGLDLF